MPIQPPLSYEIERKIINFDEVEFPETLYKYRFLSKELHHSILTNREVFFSPPSGFEDPLDCKIPTRWDLLSDEDIINYYFDDSSRVLPQNSSIEERMQFAIHHANNNELRDEKFIVQQQQKQFAEYDNRIGVLSLTPFNNLSRLWEKYADQQKGFCIGFEPYYMLKGIGTGAGLVVYHEELPVILPLYKMPFEMQMHHQMFGKLNKWSFEEEYRTFISKNGVLSKEERKKTIPAEAYKEIIIGAKMTDEDISKLKSVIPVELQHVQLKKAILKDGVITIENL